MRLSRFLLVVVALVAVASERKALAKPFPYVLILAMQLKKPGGGSPPDSSPQQPAPVRRLTPKPLRSRKR